MRRDKSGTTMVEVIVAVLIVSVVMALFAKVVGASVQMYRRSLDIIRQTEQFNEAYYKKAGETSKVAGTLTLEEQKSKFCIELRGEISRFTDNGAGGTGLSRYRIEPKETSAAPESE